MVRILTSRLLLAALAVGVAGCGSITYPGQAGNGIFSLRASSLTVGTNGQIVLRALLPSGDPVPVKWSIASGTNAPSLGQGHVDATGVYSAPGSLSSDSIAVRVEAALASDAQSTAWLTVEVHPGFVQPLLPQNVALTPGATADVTAQIAEVNAGSVKWRLATAPAGEDNTASGTLGTLGSGDCDRSSDHYTTCTVTYTAPSALPVQPVYVVAAVNGSTVTSPLRVLLNGQGIVSNPAANQAIQTGPVLLGASGGNDGDFDTYADDSKGESYVADCCGGTLGALVEDESEERVHPEQQPRAGGERPGPRGRHDRSAGPHRRRLHAAEPARLHAEARRDAGVSLCRWPRSRPMSMRRWPLARRERSTRRQHSWTGNAGPGRTI